MVQPFPSKARSRPHKSFGSIARWMWGNRWSERLRRGLSRVPSRPTKRRRSWFAYITAISKREGLEQIALNWNGLQFQELVAGFRSRPPDGPNGARQSKAKAPPVGLEALRTRISAAEAATESAASHNRKPAELAAQPASARRALPCPPVHGPPSRSPTALRSH